MPVLDDGGIVKDAFDEDNENDVEGFSINISLLGVEVVVSAFDLLFDCTFRGAGFGGVGVFLFFDTELCDNSS